MQSFQLVGISPDPFQPLFELPDAELARQHASRVVATKKPGFPCRVSLVDAEVGEELLLLPYTHQPAASPYQASGPVFVRRGAEQRFLAVNEVPEYVSLRLMSLRAYDSIHMIVDADVCEGLSVVPAIERLFADGRVQYIHLHNAKRGCFSCLVRRA
jgi:hypothetical protein